MHKGEAGGGVRGWKTGEHLPPHNTTPSRNKYSISFRHGGSENAKKEHKQPPRRAAKVRESAESANRSPLAPRLEGPLEELPADEFPPLIRLRGAGKVPVKTSIPQVEMTPFKLLLHALLADADTKNMRQQ